ncbi:MAG TPA: DUF1329 domain-containing protein [Candidatus Binataceae bacterium]|nr:DUF1329 domain-containing protein [Candidatus Binataceae bacterium]
MNGRKNKLTWLVVAAAAVVLVGAAQARAQVKPGDFITPDNAFKVKDLLPPGDYMRVLHGMSIKVEPTELIEWPPPYKEATEKYSSQVRLSNDHRSLVGYVAGQPFPMIDANDPNAGTEVVWNEVFRPISTDDYDLRWYQCEDLYWGLNKSYFEILDNEVGHYAGYNEVGRTEVEPIPTDPDFRVTGRYYATFNGPVLAPATSRGSAELKFMYADPKRENDTWSWSPGARRLRRLNYSMEDSSGGIDDYNPNHWEGWSGKPEDYDYKFLGEKTMLAAIDVHHGVDVRCPTDGGASHCPDPWELRRQYVVEAVQRADRVTARLFSREIIYVDSEADFPMFVDMYDQNGALLKNYTSWMNYADRAQPGSRIAIYPFKRLFQVGSSTQNVQNGMSGVCYHPSANAPTQDSWFINMGAVNLNWFMPEKMAAAAEGGRWESGD